MYMYVCVCVCVCLWQLSGLYQRGVNEISERIRTVTYTLRMRIALLQKHLRHIYTFILHVSYFRTLY